VKKNITLVENTNEIFKAQQLTIGLDLTVAFASKYSAELKIFTKTGVWAPKGTDVST
jgi:hypothetical protein